MLFVVGFETVLNLSFLLIGTINTLVGTIQEIKSKKKIKKLKLLTCSKITVKRDGKDLEVLP